MKVKFLSTGLVIAALAVLFTLFAQASSSDGTINSTFKYAWSENIGWLNFGTTNGNVHVTASKLTGYIWSDNYGWINLNPAGSGVKNDGTGVLSGSAWGEQTGYINFSGVGIDSEGSFGGTANGSTTGRIVFSCASCRVLTDWRAAAASPVSSGGGGGAGSSGGGGAAAPFSGIPPIINAITAPIISAVTAPISAVSKTTNTLLTKAAEILKGLIHFGAARPPESPPVAVVKPGAPVPMVFLGIWNLLPEKPIHEFVFAPLPEELLHLAEKFPKLGKTFGALGIARQSDLPKLLSAKFSLPGLTENLSLFAAQVSGGKVAPPSGGIPLKELGPQVKGLIPTEVVFVRSSNEKIDLDVKLAMTNSGAFLKKLQTVAGSNLQLVVRPQGPVKAVEGYLIFRNSNRSAAVGEKNNNLTLQTALASLIFQNPLFAQAVTREKVQAEKRLALAQFEYSDPDGDGIYTANVKMPKVEGDYDIVTIISYEDPKLGVKEIDLIAVVDPEGYVYEKRGDKELRIPQAAVSLYSLNSATNKYELWPADKYSQVNPQKTELSGTYAFLVPPGSYYIAVVAAGYEPYVGARFTVAAGNGVHFNVELHPLGWWNKVDWTMVLVVLVALSVALNFYFDRRKVSRSGNPPPANYHQ